MAFNIDLTENGATGTPGDVPEAGLRKFFTMERTIDFTVTANQLANAQVAAIFTVPAYVLVEEVMILVHTADADITDVDVGNYTTAGVATVVDGFIDGATIATTGLKRDVTGETYSPQSGTVGFMGTTDWVVSLYNNDAQTIDGAILTIIAKCQDLRVPGYTD